MVTANTALSSSLRDLSGANTTPAKECALPGRAGGHRGARSRGCAVGAAGHRRSSPQQVQQALTQENGYLQAVGATLSTQSQGNISQVRPLGNQRVEFARHLPPGDVVAPGIGASRNGSDQLISWANGRVARGGQGGREEDQCREEARHLVLVIRFVLSFVQLDVGQSGHRLRRRSARRARCTSCPFAENVQQAWYQVPAGRGHVAGVLPGDRPGVHDDLLAGLARG